MVRNARSCGSPRSGPEGHGTPKKSGAGSTLAQTLAPFVALHKPGSSATWSARLLIAAYGSLRPPDLTPLHVRALNAALTRTENPFTRQLRASSLRRILRELHSEHGAPRLAEHVLQTKSPRPRNVTATSAERTAILGAAAPHLRCWLLLCSDLALRSGTAARIAPSHYDAATRRLTFRTKYDAAQTLEVTDEVARILSRPGLKPELPYVAQLPRGTGKNGRTMHCLNRMSADSLRNSFARLRRELGITRKLTPHDLRRTTAVAVYEQTQDLRLVQALLGHSDLNSTLWYLDHHLTPVPVTALELAKLNPTKDTIQ